MPKARGRPRLFEALAIQNFRLYITGQCVSVAGNWAQNVGIGWLSLELSANGTVLGMVMAARYLPVFLFSPWAGLLADRHDARRVMLIALSIEGGFSLALAVMTGTGAMTIPILLGLSFALGLSKTASVPAQQSLINEIVPPEFLGNAIALTSITINVARVVGPAAAAVGIAAVGVQSCFYGNAATFVAIIGTVALMHIPQHARPERVARAPGQIREGLRYVMRTPRLLATVLMTLVTGALTWEYPVTLPLFATQTFHGGATLYGAMTSVLAVGAIVGGVFAAKRSTATADALVVISIVWGVSMVVAAWAGSQTAAFISLVLVGGMSTLFNAGAKTVLQLESVDHMRGRVMALWFMAWQGSTLLGAPVVGAVADQWGARWSLFAGGIGAIFAGALGLLIVFRGRIRRGSTVQTRTTP
jgi:MFS family permease